MNEANVIVGIVLVVIGIVIYRKRKARKRNTGTSSGGTLRDENNIKYKEK